MKENKSTIVNTAVVSNCEAWTPTCRLRWKKLSPHKKELQQLWQGSNGSEEWRPIEFVVHD